MARERERNNYNGNNLKVMKLGSNNLYNEGISLFRKIDYDSSSFLKAKSLLIYQSTNLTITNYLPVNRHFIYIIYQLPMQLNQITLSILSIYLGSFPQFGG